MVDEFYIALEANEEKEGLIMNERFIMGIFQGIKDELHPFEKYWTNMFQNKSMHVICDCQSKLLPFAILRDKLFLTEDNTNKYTYSMIGGVEVTSAKALLVNIRDLKKATAEHLSSAGKRLCSDYISDADHAAGLFKMSVNDPTEISLAQ